MPIPKTIRRSLGNACVAIDHGVLNFDGAAHGVDDATELYDRAVAGALDHAPVMRGDSQVDKIAAQRPAAAPECDTSSAPASRL